MDENLPKVSIVLPTHNGAKYIRESIDSCLNQTYQNIELIIIDDCSTDDTPSIVNSYKNTKIKLLRHDQNKGVSNALNTGFSVASGKYFTWTSDDNYYNLNAIEKFTNFMEANKNIDFVYSDYYLSDENGIVRLTKTGISDHLLKTNVIGPCFMFKRIVYETLGGFKEEAFLCEDYEYWMRVYTNNFNFAKVPEPLYFYRMHPGNLSIRWRLWTAKKKDIVRSNFILKELNFGRNKNSRLFLEIAQENYADKYVCLRNLYLSLSQDPAILIKSFPYFVKLFIKLILGQKIIK